MTWCVNGTHPPAGKTEKAIQNVNIPPVSVTLYPFLQPKQGGIFTWYIYHMAKRNIKKYHYFDKISLFWYVGSGNYCKKYNSKIKMISFWYQKNITINMKPHTKYCKTTNIIQKIKWKLHKTTYHFPGNQTRLNKINKINKNNHAIAKK